MEFKTHVVPFTRPRSGRVKQLGRGGGGGDLGRCKPPPGIFLDLGKTLTRRNGISSTLIWGLVHRCFNQMYNGIARCLWEGQGVSCKSYLIICQGFMNIFHEKS